MARIRGLAQLARAYGINTSYVDLARQRQTASDDALIATLRALRAPVAGANDVADALRERRLAEWRRAVEPVNVCWDGRSCALELRRPAARADRSVRVRLELQDGESRTWRFEPPSRAVLRKAELEGERFVAQRMRVPGRIPAGYHKLIVEQGRYGDVESLLISAPTRAFEGEEESVQRDWGVFMPLYALRTESSWGAGDFTDLGRLSAWVGGLGGRIVATLPLLAAYLEENADPSPYSPVSRLFWNEVFVDVHAASGLAECAGAREALEERGLARQLEELRGSRSVDYSGAIRARRAVLEPLTRCFFANAGEKSPAYRGFLRDNPQVEEYARFRAQREAHGADWTRWPEQSADVSDRARYHLFAQFVASQQLTTLANATRADGRLFYLDLPLGVRPDGYDVWRERDLFVRGVSVGAPPDPFFSKGQSWGFPPLHPEALRDAGHRYFIDCIRNHMRYAGVLRLDHVMGLHRLFWIPTGMGAGDGLYVQYPAEELYAILSLESHRHRTLLVGEDLGTVPRAVRTAMSRHGLQRMAVLQFDADAERKPPVHVPPRNRVASVNTHDMPPFAAFWTAADVADREDLGLLDAAGAAEERERRARMRTAMLRLLRREKLLASADTEDVTRVHRACLELFGAGRARVVLCAMEDLWGELRPQNSPGTVDERPNWRRKAAYAFEEFSTKPTVVETLRALDRTRRDGSRR
jgi:4-alpha-glucanotransferase